MSLGSYSIGTSGMFANRAALAVVSQNISNVNTPGYVRQQMIFENARLQNLTGNMQVGTGVEVSEIRQIRSVYLDNVYRQENKELGYWEGRSTTYENVESVLGAFTAFGISDTSGVKETMDDFFDSWQELSKDSDSLTKRALVRQSAVSFVEAVNYLGDLLGQIQTEVNSKIKDGISRTNEIAEEIAELNIKVLEAENTGDKANDYRDQRNLLLDELSNLIDVKCTEKTNHTITVTTDGNMLVNGNDTFKIEAVKLEDGSDFYTPVWELSGQKLDLSSGYLKGLIESRGEVKGSAGSVENGSPVETGETDADIGADLLDDAYNFDPQSLNIISEIRKGVNSMVNILARKINAIHREGIGLEGSTGDDFFVKIDEDLPFEMGNIAVNPEFYDLNRIATSNTGELGDNNIAVEIANVKSEKLLRVGNLYQDFDDYFSSVISWIGSSGQESYGNAESQQLLTRQIDERRHSISSVSMDEEMTNIIKFQQAYNANAKAMSLIDDMVEVMINKLGRVGL